VRSRQRLLLRREPGRNAGNRNRAQPQDYNQAFPGGTFPPPMPMAFENTWRNACARTPGSPNYGIIDEGISGNRILNDVAGPSALSRFDRDAVTEHGEFRARALLPHHSPALPAASCHSRLRARPALRGRVAWRAVGHYG